MNFKLRNILIACKFVVVLTITLVSNSFAADSITLKVGYSAGGGYDLMARFVARHLGNYLPSNPSVTVQNVPGAGSLKLAKLMVATEPKDGTVVALVNPSLVVATKTKPDKANFDANSLNWVGSLSDTSSLCYVGNNSDVKTIDDFYNQEFILGASGKTSATYVLAALTKNIFKTNFKIVTGFKGGNEIDVAIARGEIQGRCGNSATSYSKGQAKDSSTIMGYWGLRPDSSLPDAVSLFDQIEDEKDRAAAKLLIGSLSFHHPLFLPPGTPQDVVSELRLAFSDMISDPVFLQDAAESGIIISPKSGADVAELITEVISVSPEVIERAGELSQ